jgi:putative Mn2+ efflux pump MntP
MGIIELLLVAVALGTDAFSLAIGIGMRGISNRRIWRLSGTVFLFHVFMPLIGVLLGQLLGELVGRYAVWIGAGLIVLIGLNMVRQSLNSEEPVKAASLHGWGLLVLSFSVSLDALSVGLGLGTLFDQRLPLTVGTIGLMAGLMTATGLMFGRHLGKWLADRAELIGGLVLVAVGIKLAF